MIDWHDWKSTLNHRDCTLTYNAVKICSWRLLFIPNQCECCQLAQPPSPGKEWFWETFQANNNHCNNTCMYNIINCSPWSTFRQYYSNPTAKANKSIIRDFPNVKIQYDFTYYTIKAYIYWHKRQSVYLCDTICNNA